VQKVSRKAKIINIFIWCLAVTERGKENTIRFCMFTTHSSRREREERDAGADVVKYYICWMNTVRAEITIEAMNWSHFSREQNTLFFMCLSNIHKYKVAIGFKTCQNQSILNAWMLQHQLNI